MSLADELSFSDKHHIPNLDLLAEEKPRNNSRLWRNLFLISFFSISTASLIFAYHQPVAEKISSRPVPVAPTPVTQHLVESKIPVAPAKPVKMSKPAPATVAKVAKVKTAKTTTVVETVKPHPRPIVQVRKPATPKIDPFTQAELALEQEDLVRAEHLLQTLATQYKHHKQFLRLKTYLLIKENKLQEAAMLLSNVLRDDSEDVSLLALGASNALRMEDNQGAAKYYLRLTQLEPNEARWWFGLANALQAQNEIEAALTAYQRSIQLGQLRADLRAHAISQIQALTA